MDYSVSEALAIVFIIGFAIQQVLQILDPFVMAGISKCKNSRPNKDLPGGMSDGDFKKAVMSFLSFTLGAIAVALVRVRLLRYLPCVGAGTCAALIGWAGQVGDFFVTALVLGSGTEAVNIVLKFMGYVKDAQKPELQISIAPNTVTVVKGKTFQFQAVVSNSTNKAVAWKVLHGDGGSINETSGFYTAPVTGGTYQVMATSKADPTKSALATVTVPA